MRTAAGILIILLGIFSFLAPTGVADAIALERALAIGGVDIIERVAAIRADINTQTILVVILLQVLIVGGGICTLIRRDYWWAFSAAICSLVAGAVMHRLQTVGSVYSFIYIPIAVLAIILLVNRREEFAKRPPSK